MRPRSAKFLVVATAAMLAVAGCVAAYCGEAPPPTTTPTAPSVAPSTAPTVSDPEAIAVLRMLEKRHSDHRRARGVFRQLRKDPVFLEDIESTGQFYYERPNRFRCDYDKPEASSHWVIGNIVTSYYPSLKQVERYKLRTEAGIGEVNQMLLAFGIETERILKYFIVKTVATKDGNRVRLLFLPKAPRRERPFRQFVLDISKPDLQPLGFKIIGDDGDETTVEIKKITWNPPLPAGTFDLKFPPDVEIIEEE